MFPFPKQLETGDLANLVSLIISETDHQVANRQARDEQLGDEESILEFQMACDALNCGRVLWRCREEVSGDQLPADINERIGQMVRERRGYDAEEFDLVLDAVRHRVRAPYGLSLLQLALKRAERNPIELKDPDLAGSQLPTLIAGVAQQLQKIRGDDYILLPLERLRDLLKRRKLVVSGAILRLIKHGVLEEISEYQPGTSARKFKFTAQEGKDFVIKAQEPALQAEEVTMHK